jgi:NitT/TauT family transport system substrate-binding protein
MSLKRSAAMLLIAAFLAIPACRRNAEQDVRFRLGYFPNLTHAQALVGSADGTFARALPAGRLDVKRFNAGPGAMEALLAGDLDVTYVGSAPAINAFVRSHGALRVISGAASGGAIFVTRTARAPEDLKGKRVASPQVGSSPDVALRGWLESKGLAIDTGEAGVTVTPLSNPDILNMLRRGQLEGAWVPEPWGARLLAEAGAHLFVDERALWDGGRFPTTVLVASSQALTGRRKDVLAILRAHVELTRRAEADLAGFQRLANAEYAALTGKALPEQIVADAFSRIDLLIDPMAAQLAEAASHAVALGFIPASDVSGLVDRSLLDELARELPPAAQ